MGQQSTSPEDSARRPQEQMSEVLLRVLCKEIRRDILRALNGKGAAKSPKELAEEISLELGNTSYHTKVLARAGAIELVRTEPVRGSTAHFYASAVSKNPMVLAILSETEREDQRSRAKRQRQKPKRKKGRKKGRKK